ncbi:MAG: DUF1501 domain-containing protein [Bryobacteraceae bacterium]
MTRRELLALAAAAPVLEARPAADRFLLITLSGAPAQTDTFDPKHYTPFEPGMLARNLFGACRSIPTAISGVRIAEGLENIAAVLDRGAIIRTVAARAGEPHVPAQRRLAGRLRLERLAAPTFAAQLEAAARRVIARPAMLHAALPFVPFAGFDTHDRGADRTAQMKRAIDAPVARLIRDLESSGALASTLVVVAPEFGRTVRPAAVIRTRDDYGYHEHFHAAFSVLLFGAGVQRGRVHGRTADEHPMVPVEKPVPVDAVAAMIGAAVSGGARYGSIL